MKQARVLTATEMKRLLAVMANGRHAERNRLAVMLSFLAGLRVGEIAGLTVADLVDRDGEVRDQVRLNPAHTKGRPDATRIYAFANHIRDTMPDVVTLPQHFKAHGYHTVGFGKIFHGGKDDAASWSEPHYASRAQR